MTSFVCHFSYGFVLPQMEFRSISTGNSFENYLFFGLYVLLLPVNILVNAAKITNITLNNEFELNAEIGQGVTDQGTVDKLTEKIDSYSLDNQFLILICDRSPRFPECKSFPFWLTSYQNETLQKLKFSTENDTIEIEPEDDKIEFFETENKNLVDEFSPENSKERLNVYAFPVLLYVVSGRVFVYEGRFDDNTSLSEWLDDFRSSVSITVDATNFNFLLEQLFSTREKILLLIYDTSAKVKACETFFGDKTYLKWWHNLARSLADVPAINVGHVDLAEGTAELEEDSPTRVEIQPRLPVVNLQEICPQIVVLQENNYTIFPPPTPDINLKTLTKSIRRFARKANVISTKQRGDWLEIHRPLTEIERFYYTEESKMDRERRRSNFIMIGATGGLGVIVLAISIFWGLKTSDVVVITD